MVTELNDGYGDHHPRFDAIEDTIRENEKLLRIKAADRSVGSSGNDWDDLLNEGRITQWEVLSKRPDAPREYVSAAVSKRMTEVVMRGKWTGQPSQRGKPSVDPLRRTDRDSFDDPDFQVDVTAPEALDALLLAYHEGEILRALDALPERHKRYVVLRFWGGWTNTECAPILGVKPGNVARMWTDSIRPVLARELAHLADF